MFAKITDGAIVKFPYTLYDLQQDNPNTSFPASISVETMLEFGAVPVAEAPRPECDESTHKVMQDGLPTQDANGNWVLLSQVVPLTAEEIVGRKNALQGNIVGATQQRLDNFARTRGYDGILSACTYATSPTDKFQIEGQYCVISRDATWAKLYQMLGEIQAGTRPIPTGYADIEPELPPLVWPT